MWFTVRIRIDFCINLLDEWVKWVSVRLFTSFHRGVVFERPPPLVSHMSPFLWKNVPPGDICASGGGLLTVSINMPHFLVCIRYYFWLWYVCETVLAPDGIKTHDKLVQLLYSVMWIYSECLQEAQLSQRDRAMLRVIEYFAKSLMVTQGHSKWQC